MSAHGAVEIGRGRNDAMGLALLTMAQEMWLLKDRQMVLEAVLADKGLLDGIDDHQPSAELSQRLADERNRFVTAITTILATGKPAA